jgi:hypothetical protein
LQEKKRLLGKKVETGKGESVMNVVRKTGIQLEELKQVFARESGWERVSMKGLENIPKIVEVLDA